MKLSKNLGRIATTFLATAMLAGLTAVPASAATLTSGVAGSGDGEPTSVIDTLEFNSVLKLPANVSVPTATFTYTLTGADASETITGSDGSVVTVKPGTGTITGTIVDETSFSTASSDVAGDIKTVTDTVSIPLTTDSGETNYLHFSEVGIYKYTLTQELKAGTGNADDFTMTSVKDRAVYLYVARVNGAYQVTGIVMVDATTHSAAKKSTGVFTNYYLMTGNPDDPTDTPTIENNTLKISNTIDGAMGDKSEKFKFTFDIRNTDSNKKYNYKVFNKADEETGVYGTVDANATMSTDNAIALGDGDYIMIYGLSKSDEFDVAQSDYETAKNEGYATKVDDNDYTAKLSKLTLASVGDGVLNFVNKRDSIAPTGLVMNVAPYVLLVLVAAGAGYVFLRKREED